MKKISCVFFTVLILCNTFILGVCALSLEIVDIPETKYVYIDDIPENAWYADARKFTQDEGIMRPTLISTVEREEEEEDGGMYKYYEKSFDFSGDRSITRAEVSAILSRYNGSYDTIYFELYKSASCPAFVDVPYGVWYTPAADWTYENGIINGVGNDCFAPDRTITREEFAAMLYRYTEYLEVDTTARVDYSEFEDSDSVSDWAHDAMSWAVAEGLINGKPGKLLAPQDTITRAEVATVIYRYNNEVKAHHDILDGN